MSDDAAAPIYSPFFGVMGATSAMVFGGKMKLRKQMLVRKNAFYCVALHCGNNSCILFLIRKCFTQFSASGRFFTS